MHAETSKEALLSILPVAGTMEAKVLQALSDGPMICHDIVEKINSKVQTVSGRLWHLADRGLIEWNGDYGRTDTGRRAKQWRLVSQ